MTPKKWWEGLERRWDGTIARLLAAKSGGHFLVRAASPQQAGFLLERKTHREGADGRGHQFVIMSGPSGVGRSTIGRELRKRGIPGIPHYTTRAPRSASEMRSGDYIYVTEKEFFRLKREGKFLQTAETYGQWRGIAKATFNSLLRRRVKFYIDKSPWTTRKLIRKKELRNKYYLKVFILPPTFGELVRRLTGRTSGEERRSGKGTKEVKTLTRKEILVRLRKAVEMLKSSGGVYDCYLVNDNVARVANLIRQHLTGRKK